MNDTPMERGEYRRQQQQEAEARITKLANSWNTDPTQISDYLRFSAQFRTYSERNRMLMYAQNPNTTFAASYKDYQKMGYHIRKGEHGMKILAPAPKTYFRLTPQHPWVSIRAASDLQKQQIAIGMLESRQEMHFAIGTVFDITQTTCPLEDYPKLLGLGYKSEQHAAMYKTVCEYCDSIGMPVSESAQGLVTRGLYNTIDHHIEINDLLGDSQKLSTVFHEMSHGIMEHGVDASVSTAQVEFEADALAIMLEDKFGIPITDARQQHLAEHFKAYRERLEADGAVFSPEKVFAKVHERFDEHSVAMESFFAERGITPEHNPFVQIQEEALKADIESPIGADVTAVKLTQEELDRMASNPVRLENVNVSYLKIPENLQGEFVNCTFHHCDFSDARISATFERCSIEEPITTAAVFEQASFRESTITHAHIYDADFRDAVFEQCKWEQVIVKNTQFDQLTFQNCSMDAVRVDESTIVHSATGLDTIRATNAPELRSAFEGDGIIIGERLTSPSVDRVEESAKWLCKKNDLPYANDLKENVYALSERMVRASSPKATADIVHAEASGITYATLEKMGIRTTAPNLKHLSFARRQLVLKHIAKGSDILCQQLTGNMPQEPSHTHNQQQQVQRAQAKMPPKSMNP